MRKCMIALFFAILLMPGVLGALLGGAAEGQNTENRTLAERPELSFENLEDFPADAEAYINDHAPFRDQFIDAYASMNMELFHSIDNNDVIVGKEDWLFYAGNDSRVDALGISPFTEVEQWSITTQLLQIRQKYGKDRDSFVFFIAPDKISPFVMRTGEGEEGMQNGLLKVIADDHWSEDNRNLYAFWPRLTDRNNPNNTQPSTWWMRNGSFLRLKSVELGYTLPAKTAQKIKLSNLRVYVNASNLFCISSFKLWDPEMGGNGLGYPLQRVYNIGINLGL